MKLMRISEKEEDKKRGTVVVVEEKLLSAGKVRFQIYAARAGIVVLTYVREINLEIVCHTEVGYLHIARLFVSLAQGSNPTLDCE